MPLSARFPQFRIIARKASTTSPLGCDSFEQRKPILGPKVNFRFARRPLTDLRWFLGLVSAGEPRQHGMADSLYERMLSTRRVHRLAAILLRRWQAEEIAKTPFPCVSRIWTEYMRSKCFRQIHPWARLSRSSMRPSDKISGRCLTCLLDRLQKFQQVGVDFVLVSRS